MKASFLVALLALAFFGEAAAAPARKPTAFDSLARKATAARAAGRLEEAAGQYAKALALRPAWSEGRLALATVLFDLQRHAEARDHLRRLTAEAKGGSEAWAMLGLAASRLRDYADALTALDRARAMGITNPQLLSAVLFEAALLLNRTGNHDAAFEVLRAFAQEGKDAEYFARYVANPREFGNTVMPVFGKDAGGSLTDEQLSQVGLFLAASKGGG